MASQGFVGYYEALNETVAPELAAETLLQPPEEVLALPDLATLDQTQLTQVLSESSAAARSAEALPASVHAALAAADVSTMNLGAPILGTPINNSRSWRFQDTYYWADCPNSCNVTGHAQFTYTIDPGEIRTRVTVNTLEIGDALESYGITVQPYFNAQWWGIYQSGNWATNSTRTLWLDHSSTLGQSLIFHVLTWVWGPAQGVAADYEFRTNITAKCEEPSPGAYQCRFL
ncbi:hypothetical protein [Microbacterium oxydans]|uniref:hypothetical protein n=1 Tax=Microbacterium oxydans TaxID=82380 RepID=UPI00366BE59E